MYQTFPTTPKSSIHSIGIWNSWYRTTSISLVRKNPFTLSSSLHQKKPTKGSKPNNWQLWKSIGQGTLGKYKVHKKKSKVPLRILRIYDMYKQVQC
jgi:hypothetical protein